MLNLPDRRRARLRGTRRLLRAWGHRVAANAAPGLDVLGRYLEDYFGFWTVRGGGFNEPSTPPVAVRRRVVADLAALLPAWQRTVDAVASEDPAPPLAFVQVVPHAFRRTQIVGALGPRAEGYRHLYTDPPAGAQVPGWVRKAAPHLDWRAVWDDDVLDEAARAQALPGAWLRWTRRYGLVPFESAGEPHYRMRRGVAWLGTLEGRA